MDYTERMRDLLAQRGMTQAELAAKSKTKQQTVSGWLRSKDVNTRVIGYIMEWIQYTKLNPL